VTSEDARIHLGVETPRRRSDLAIERETPALLGFYSVVTLVGDAFLRSTPIAMRAAAWYPEAEATFSEFLAAVRWDARVPWQYGSTRPVHIKSPWF
jgi:hypothetical protein